MLWDERLNDEISNSQLISLAKWFGGMDVCNLQ